MPDGLYDTDWFAWTRDQASRLRALSERRVNTDLDLDHLAEEVQDLGDNLLAVVEGNLVQVAVHLLKLEWSPDPQPRLHWMAEVDAFRAAVHRRLRRSPTAVRHIGLDAVYADALRIARRWAVTVAPQPDLPETSPYTLDRLLDFEFFPANRHGLD